MTCHLVMVYTQATVTILLEPTYPNRFVTCGMQFHEVCVLSVNCYLFLASLQYFNMTTEICNFEIYKHKIFIFDTYISFLFIININHVLFLTRGTCTYVLSATILYYKIKYQKYKTEFKDNISVINQVLYFSQFLWWFKKRNNYCICIVAGINQDLMVENAVFLGDVQRSQ